MRVVSALLITLSLVSVTWTSVNVNVYGAAIRVASIGDYGSNSKGEEAVAKLVADWKPDFIITSGDNNYYLGLESSIDTNIGKYYASYIGNYRGKHAEKTAAATANTNRFFPSPGNHDWLNIFAGKKGRLSAYIDYFTLPGNERYYDFVAGPVHFFALDSDGNEPDGNTVNSVQATWLKQTLANSTSRWKIAYFHHPPYSSGYHQSSLNMRWPYEDWGVTAVIGGHDHLYERINPPTSTIPYFVNGFGGALQGYFGRYGSIVEGSMVRYNLEHGAMFIEADENKCIFTVKTTYGDVIDRYVQGEGQPMMMKENSPRSLLTGRTATLSTSSLPMLWNGNILNNFKSDWKAKDFNDGGWSKGISPLGYGSRLAWGTDIGNNHGNRWFRYHFTLTSADLASIGTSVVQLRVLSDDGADVYLNGQLVDANADGGHKLEYWNRYVAIDKNLLVAGDNVFAAFLKNTIFTMSGGFDLDLVILTPSGSTSFPAPQAGPLGVEPNPSNRSFSNIPDFGDLPIRLASMLGTAPAVSILTGKDTVEGKGAGAVWQFIAKNDMLDASWSSVSYDDSTWQRGASPLGYNHVNNTEPIPFTTTLPTQATYYYFRYTFVVHSSTYASWSYANQLQYRLAASEGADLYINGVVIDEDISQQHPLVYWNRQEEFSSQLFNVGTNVIAIVVKSTGATAATGMDFDIANLLPYAPVVENGKTISVNAAITVTMSIPFIPTVVVSVMAFLLSILM